jgi:carbon monoxide dehydrogenase subunit G
MIHFEGEVRFPLLLPEVAEKLSDAGYLAHSLTDAEIISATPEKAVWRIKPKLSFLTGTQTTEMTRSDHRPNEAVTFTLTTRSIGASSTVVAQLRFAADPQGTQVLWNADITEVSGLLKMVPSGLLEGAARKIIEDVWEAVRRRLLPPATP